MVSPPSQSERRLVWHPKRTNKFVVGGGSQVTLYEWATDHPGIRHVTSRQDTHMRCFSFSPDDRFDDLLAIGHHDGRVDLIRLEASKYAGHNNILSSGPIQSLKVKNSRPCNALAFSNVNPNYLAVGLDKVRGDNSLMIWDIQSALPLLPEDKFPIPDLCTSTDSIPRTEIGPRSDSRILQQHAPAEVVSAISFIPNSANILIAGISNRWLRMFDLRKPTPSTTSAAFKVQGIVTDSFDPHRFGCFGDGLITIWDSRKLPHPVLTFGEKDAMGDGALLHGNAYSMIEFSPNRRGTLASLERDGSYVRFWNIQECAVQSVDGLEKEINRESPNLGSNTSKLSWAALPWTSALNYPPQLSPGPTITSLSSYVLANTRHTKPSSRSLASFAIVPGQRHSLMSRAMVVTKEGDIELHDLYDTPKHTTWSARGDLTVTAGFSCRTIYVKDNPVETLKLWEVPRQLSDLGSNDSPLTKLDTKVNHRQNAQTPLFGRGDEDGFPALLHPRTSTFNPTTPGKEVYDMNSAAHEAYDLPEAPQIRQLKGVEHVICDDISMIMKRRAIKGYGIGDAAHNLKLLEEENAADCQPLLELWSWINHSRGVIQTSESQIHGFDFAYEGLLGIWEGFKAQGDIVTQPQLHFPQVVSRSRSPMDVIQSEYNLALEKLASRSNPFSWKPMIHTGKPLRRQVCLHLCGWGFTEEQIANDVKNWEDQGKISRAACWLVFTGQFNKAIELLLRSEEESHHMMAGTLAAMSPQHGSSVTRNPELQKHCEHLIVKLQDPYFRALLTYLIHGDWSDVLSEEVFPFRERLAIAFQFLDDKSLTSYLKRCNGHVDSLIVTGLTNSGMHILADYVDRTADVQTAAILTSYVHHWKIRDDARAEHWIETYRALLDSFKLYGIRVAFDTNYGQLVQSAMKSTVPPVFSWIPRQILIRCNYCNRTISGPGSVLGEKVTACPYCNRALPRCAVCLMTLDLVQSPLHDADMVTHFVDNTRDAIVICQSCRHGGHASHILEWFFNEDGTLSHEVCAVADCDCSCANNF